MRLHNSISNGAFSKFSNTDSTASTIYLLAATSQSISITPFTESSNGISAFTPAQTITEYAHLNISNSTSQNSMNLWLHRALKHTIDASASSNPRRNKLCIHFHTTRDILNYETKYASMLLKSHIYVKILSPKAQVWHVIYFWRNLVEILWFIVPGLAQKDAMFINSIH